MGDYNPAFDVNHLVKPGTIEKPVIPVEPKSKLTKQNIEAEPREPTMRKPVGLRQPKQNKKRENEVAYIRGFPRVLLNHVQRRMPDHLTLNQTEAMIAFVLYSLDIDLTEDTLSYHPTDEIKEAVSSLRSAALSTEERGLTSIGTSVGKLGKKLDKISDLVLLLQMMQAYDISVGTGLHAPGRISSGQDLKLGHDGVIQTSIKASEEFRQYKQIVTDYAGRVRK